MGGKKDFSGNVFTSWLETGVIAALLVPRKFRHSKSFGILKTS
jgi:hypothetical protein